ncbi:MAG: MBL fold metallo-hydrolase [Candidatus ainarchaeum sp.]|nr:MBL fold metallo-hydrolase [Candidatus ainarchaeum sp.]
MANSFEYQGVRISWFGHSSFLLEYGEEAIYIDNYVLPDVIGKKATIIVHTHGHYDHCADCAKIADAKTVYAGMCKHARDFIGNKLKIRDVEIEFVDAYNNGKPFHHKNTGCGVIINLGGTRIYHAGDTDFIVEMQRYRCDVALLPIGGSVTMDEKEAMEAVKAIGPKIVIPMHYNYLPMTKADPGYFRKLVEQNAPRTRVVVLDAIS